MAYLTIEGLLAPGVRAAQVFKAALCHVQAAELRDAGLAGCMLAAPRPHKGRSRQLLQANAARVLPLQLAGNPHGKHYGLYQKLARSHTCSSPYSTTTQLRAISVSRQRSCVSNRLAGNWLLPLGRALAVCSCCRL